MYLFILIFIHLLYVILLLSDYNYIFFFFLNIKYIQYVHMQVRMHVYACFMLDISVFHVKYFLLRLNAEKTELNNKE